MNVKFPEYPTASPGVIDAVVRQLKSGAWTRLEGAPELEAQWEQYQGTGHAWFLSSGTAALEACFLGHGIGPGDEIVTTPYTWGASVSAILAIGAIPVFADINLQTGQIDPESVRRCISRKTKAVLAVHLFGTPSPMDILRAVTDEHDLLLFEDASQAHGARLNGERVGNFGDAAAFSCMGMKPLGGTEGGLAQFRTPEAREKAYLYGRHPRGIDPDRVAHLQKEHLLDTLQLGWRPSAISAAILEARLPDLDGENEGRRKNARKLRNELEGLPGVYLPEDPAGSEPVYHLLSFIVDPQRCPFTKAGVMERLRGAGLPIFSYIPEPVHRMKRLNPAGYEGPPVLWHSWLKQAGVDYNKTSCPAAEERSRISFEMSWNFTTYDPESMTELSRAFHKALER